MKTVYIHCGAPKTGTSYLQVLFARYADSLLESGVIYPTDSSIQMARNGGVTSGNGVEMANYLRPELPHNIADKDLFLETFRQILSQAEERDILYSSEFIVFPQGERTSALVSAIADAGYDVRLIYCVRNIASAARSTYSQQVKRHGEARPFSDFIRTWDPYYHHHVQLIVNAFGPDKLILLNYDEERKTLADLFFRRILNTDFEIESGFVTNRSLSDQELELVRHMNEFFPVNQHHMSTFVSDALMRLEKPSIVFAVTKDEFRFFEQRFGASLGFLNRHIQGEKLKITDKIVEQRPKIELGDFEIATMAIMARLITTTLSRT